MIRVSDERFEELVDAGLDRVPQELLDNLRNTVILVRDRDPRGLHILGLYEGVALTERTSDYSGHLPDTISIYKDALENYCSTEEELAEQVAITVVHEIGHHFGIDDARLHELGY